MVFALTIDHYCSFNCFHLPYLSKFRLKASGELSPMSSMPRNCPASSSVRALFSTRSTVDACSPRRAPRTQLPLTTSTRRATPAIHTGQLAVILMQVIPDRNAMLGLFEVSHFSEVAPHTRAWNAAALPLVQRIDAFLVAQGLPT